MREQIKSGLMFLWGCVYALSLQYLIAHSNTFATEPFVPMFPCLVFVLVTSSLGGAMTFWFLKTAWESK